MSQQTASGDVSRQDIEAKLREIKGEVDTGVDRAKAPLIAVGAVVLISVVGLAYVMGRRRGKKTTTLVEVRRV